MANWTRIATTLALVLVGILILYFVYRRISSEYNQTLAGEPWLVETTKSADRMTIVPGSRIPRSNDSKFGIEFSYTFWLFINEWNNASRLQSGLHHILHKGNALAVPLQCPGVWLKKNSNTLVLKMNTFAMKATSDGMEDGCGTWLECCEIPNIPIRKWVHITISVVNRNVDIYVNGFLRKRCPLKGLPKQNDGDVYLNAFGGFNGFLSRVRYFNYYLPVWKIEQTIAQGPSDAPPADTNVFPPYLAADYWQTRSYPMDSSFPRS